MSDSAKPKRLTVRRYPVAENLAWARNKGTIERLLPIWLAECKDG